MRLKSRRRREGHELEECARGFTSRYSVDRDRLRTMMHYADSTMCRMQFLREYFGEPPGERCGRCDNCCKPVQRLRSLPGRQRRVAPSSSVARFARGQRVRHARFGSGEVSRVEGEQVIVDFVRGGERRVLASYLEPAA